jgi:dienelactone hydrolase
MAPVGILRRLNGVAFPRGKNQATGNQNFEDIARDIKQGVEFLRRQPGISRVILVGFSGGGPSTTFYQATAEKGPPIATGRATSLNAATP